MLLMPFDLETGGIDPKNNSILTAYFCITDSNLNKIDELELAMMPDDGNINYTQEALDVNGIDIEEHRKIAITYSEAVVKISDFLKKHSPKQRGIRPAGHNIAFDIGFLKEQLGIHDIWESKCHYRVLDTTPVLTFLQDVEVLPSKLGSLESLVTHFGITKLKAHTAKDDVLMWVDVYKSLKNTIKDALLSGDGGGDELSVLEI